MHGEAERLTRAPCRLSLAWLLQSLLPNARWKGQDWSSLVLGNNLVKGLEQGERRSPPG